MKITKTQLSVWGRFIYLIVDGQRWEHNWFEVDLDNKEITFTHLGRGFTALEEERGPRASDLTVTRRVKTIAFAYHSDLCEAGAEHNIRSTLLSLTNGKARIYNLATDDWAQKESQIYLDSLEKEGEEARELAGGI